MYKRPTIRKRGLTDEQMNTFMSTPSKEPPKQITEIGKKYVYVPIADVESYIRSLRYHNYSEEFIENVKMLNYKPPEIIHKIDSVKTRIIVGKRKVFVRVIAPFDEIRKYFKVGKIPPIEVQIRCLQLNGEYTHVLRKKYKDYLSAKHKKNYVIHDIFKLPFKPVKKVIHPSLPVIKTPPLDSQPVPE